jgi:hypothetical protein
MPTIQLTSAVTCDEHAIEYIHTSASKMIPLSKYITQCIYINDPDTLVYPSHASLFEAFYNAYNNHINLKLKPDDVWITIAHGISRHIDNNAQKLQHLFTYHQGKKEINITLYPNDMQNILPLFLNKVREDIKNKEFMSIMTCDFSTSTPITQASSTIAILASLKRYYEYTITFSCGIPALILEGTLEDWCKLIEKTKSIIKMGIGAESWLKQLLPILQEFVNAYQGNVNEYFWGTVMDIKELWGSGCNMEVTGWINLFYPYTRLGNKRKCLNAKLEPQQFPKGMLDVEFTVTNTKEKLTLSSGIIGLYFDKQDNSVSLVHGYWIGYNTSTTDESDFIRPKLQDQYKTNDKCCSLM